MLLLIPFLSSLLFPSLHSAFAYEDPRFTVCADTTAYTANSAFSTNLALALNTLQSSTAATGFNVTTAGNLTEPVTALALCRASLSSSDCQTCVGSATLGIRLACPNQTVAQAWYTSCMVRYSGVNFVNKPETSIAFMLYNTRDAPNHDVYDRTVKSLMQKLSYAAGVSDRRSAVGRTSMLGNRTIYGYVDCTRDVNGGDCTTCLLNATDAISHCCLGKWAGWIATPTCNVQFNMDPVHDDWINPPYINTDMSPAPAPEIGPPTAVDKRGSDGGGVGAANGKEIGILVAVIVTMVLKIG